MSQTDKSTMTPAEEAAWVGRMRSGSTGNLGGYVDGPSKSDRVRAALRQRYPDKRIPWGVAIGLSAEFDISSASVYWIVRQGGYELERP